MIVGDDRVVERAIEVRVGGVEALARGQALERVLHVVGERDDCAAGERHRLRRREVARARPVGRQQRVEVIERPRVVAGRDPELHPRTESHRGNPLLAPRLPGIDEKRSLSPR